MPSLEHIRRIADAIVDVPYYLSPQGQMEVTDFAKRVVDTNLDEYASRGQTDTERIIGQIARGKVAEVAVYRLWQEMDLDRIIEPPDFDVYSANDKDFSADLRSVDTHLHVKSVSEEDVRRYGASWVFQQNDPLVIQPSEEDVIVLCVTHGKAERSDGATVSHVLSGRKAQRYYAPMRVPHLRRTKVCIYAEDLAR